MFAYYDRDADIAWLPTGESSEVVSERVPGGLRDYDRVSPEIPADPHNPIDLPMISFMISSVPPPIGPRRASRTARSMPYSRMYP